jgi:hypothetical protein
MVMVMVIVDHGYGYGYRGPCLWLWLSWTMFMVVVMLMLYLFSFSFNVGFGMNLYLSNQMLIKLDQLKLLIAVSQSTFPYFWSSCHIIPNTCWVPTISVLSLVIIVAQRRKWCKVFWRWWWVLVLRNPRSIAYEIWSLRFHDKRYNSDNLYSLLILFSWYCCWLFTNEVTICMELDSDIHIVMHSVLSFKNRVWQYYFISSNWIHYNLRLNDEHARIEM